MLFSKYIAVSFLLFCLALDAANCADPLFNFCFSQTNYTANSPYAANLNGLLNQLSTKVPPTGFGLSSIGRGKNKVNGLALCRGDVSSTNCKTCVVDAGNELRDRCPYEKGAIIWYDYCLLKYSDTDFFGQIDNENKFYMWNVEEVKNPTSFNRKVKDLFSRLSNKAQASPKFYATGELVLGPSEKLYGLAQCTRDLSSLDCKECLDGAIGELPKYGDGKRGGRVVGGSCNVRYELYPFVDA
ncbi:Cysteine-rich repeat secretory protein 38 [Morella rubra]|uniref:Cysteine-rich repeat secretory protein 38 n=1 Tax=Morella rubra TaxID=262757 RepID=A0A6A1W7L3_9ROSI|nr:Cysteine-rich repeat secretory protein 38 [Morella rubra]KAB1221254.1 Cysteine-rich repeat secretory protein 38 [Morella rubra]